MREEKRNGAVPSIGAAVFQAAGSGLSCLVLWLPPTWKWDVKTWGWAESVLSLGLVLALVPSQALALNTEALQILW